jgi:formylglycine-generating enzyme required for sulfatase activity
MPQPPAKQFSGIFVSYRRDDSSGHAGRLFDRLVEHFGKDRIFMDIDTIEPGEDFVTVIENAVGSCEILIAVIGRHWLSGAVGTTGRLDNPNDFVRVEIATALRRDIRVIPVLVQRASMPKLQELPDELAKLSRRNAVELTDLRWQTDVDQLISVMDRVLAKREEAARLAEVARQAEEERKRREEQEKQRVEEERQLRLAEEQAKRRVAEERRLQEDKERREAEERAKLEAQEFSRRLAVESRAQAEAEERARAEQEAERRRVQTEQETERRRLEKEEQARAERERLREAAEEAKRQRADEQAIHAGREEKQPEPEPHAIPKTPGLGSEAQLSASHTMPDVLGAPRLREDRSKRTPLLIIGGVLIICCAAVIAIVVFIWMSPAPEGEQQSANQNASPASPGQTREKPNATQPTAIQQTSDNTSPANSTSSNLPPARRNQSGIEFVLIPAGSFTMGSNDVRADEQPVHRVTISEAFYMGKYEVTQAQWHAVMGNNPSLLTNCGGNCPVEQVSWDDAQQFIDRLNQANDGYNYRLPTEAEWEYACRAGTTTVFAFGDSLGSDKANFDGNHPYGVAGKGVYRQNTIPVGRFQPNAFGLYDMHGNVKEWCQDWYHETYLGAPTDGSAWLSGGEQKTRVLRGGSFYDDGTFLRSAFRYPATPGNRPLSTFGIRIVAVVRAS